MKRSVILIAVVCLLVGVGSGYAAGYLRYEPKIRSYQIQVSDLTSEVSSLEQTVSDLTSEVSGLGQTISNQEAKISTQEA